jgi:hypothetical protein
LWGAGESQITVGNVQRKAEPKSGNIHVTVDPALLVAVWFELSEGGFSMRKSEAKRNWWT